MRFVNVGFNNIVNAARVVSVISSDSAPAKRLIQDARDMGRAIDCTSGRKTRSVLITDSDHVILSAIQTETLSDRLSGNDTEDAAHFQRLQRGTPYMNEKGLIIVVSGPSGSGKGTVVKELLATDKKVGLSVSATTRAPRPQETEGVHYHFMSKERFRTLLDNGEIVEHTEYSGNDYGTLRSEIERVTGAGLDLILEIEVEGAMQIKKLYGERAVLVMLIAPNAAEQERRLRNRQTESEAVIAARLERTRYELSLAPQYEYILVNETDGLTECAENLSHIIRAARQSRTRMEPVLDAYYGK